MLKTNVAEFLSQFKQAYFIPNHGNAGDSLIAHATYKVFEIAKLNYKIIDLDRLGNQDIIKILKGKTVIYGGGGNLVDDYTYARNFIEKAIQSASELIILPHTILGHQDVIEKLGANAHIFCREQESYNYVTKHAKSTNVYFADDMALCLDARKTLEEGKKYFLPIFSSKELFRMTIYRWRRLIINHLKSKITGSKTLYAYREDVEKTDIPIPSTNLDISKIFTLYNFDEYHTFETSYRFLKFIDAYDEVHTNRLHVSIGALLLGKKVYLSDNSYGKNRAIYEASLKDKFKNLIWVN